MSVINEDDTAGVWLLTRELGGEVMTYGIEKGEFRATGVELGAGWTEFGFETPVWKRAGAVSADRPGERVQPAGGRLCGSGGGG